MCCHGEVAQAAVEETGNLMLNASQVPETPGNLLRSAKDQLKELNQQYAQRLREYQASSIEPNALKTGLKSMETNRLLRGGGSGRAAKAGHEGHSPHPLAKAHQAPSEQTMTAVSPFFEAEEEHKSQLAEETAQERAFKISH